MSQSLSRAVGLLTELAEGPRSLDDLATLLDVHKTTVLRLLRTLEEDRFVWPRRQDAVIELTTEQLHWLLDGIDIDAIRRHPARRYRHAS